MTPFVLEASSYTHDFDGAQQLIYTLSIHSYALPLQMLTLTHHHRGSGVVNSLINKLPFELHLPGYQYCGPGTKLQKRLARGDPGINDLDRSCRAHDIAYSKSSNLQDRHKADYELEQRAWERVKSKDANWKEKAAAWAVVNAMKVKRKTGMGLRRRRRCQRKVGFSETIRNVKKLFKKPNNNTLRKNVSMAMKVARLAVKGAGGRKKIKTPRVLPLPKSGGFLPLIPLFAGLSALGALTGGTAGVAKAVLDAKAAKKKLEESERHNKTMEAIALGKTGSGLYLKPHKTGLGLYLKKQQQKNYQ